MRIKFNLGTVLKHFNMFRMDAAIDLAEAEGKFDRYLHEDRALWPKNTQLAYNLGYAEAREQAFRDAALVARSKLEPSPALCQKLEIERMGHRLVRDEVMRKMPGTSSIQKVISYKRVPRAQAVPSDLNLGGQNAQG